MFVDCDAGLAFRSGFSGSKLNSVYIPQLDDGIDVLGDVFKRQQEDALTQVFVFNPQRFSADPVQCAFEVSRAVPGFFRPFDCLSHADCPEGRFCLAPLVGCSIPCGFGSLLCPSDLICAPGVRRCIAPRIAIGAANVVETRLATPPTSLVQHVTAHGVLDLLEATGFFPENPTGEKVIFRGEGRIVQDENFIVVEHDVSIELREYSGP